MAWDTVAIPFGAYWCTPFTKWQGSFAGVHALELAAQAGRRGLEARGIAPAVFDALHLGLTVPQQSSFYGGPWLAALLGAEAITGPVHSQACATSARVLSAASAEVIAGSASCVLCVTADRTSNGPHVVYPNPRGPGGKPEAEDWVWDSFSRDPWAGGAMLQTAENVARDAGISREQQDAVALMRFEQYQEALADDQSFLKRFMLLPYELTNPKGRVTATVNGDEGVFPTTQEGLAKLRPVSRDGTVTFGTQTYPADGNAGLVVTTPERAAELSRDPAVRVSVLSVGSARVAKGLMATAVVPAAQQALSRAGVAIGEVAAIKTHNPFAVNDVYFAQETGVALDAMNRFGSSLVFGHPQAPTGMRLIIELIEQLALTGGGHGLFAGCAAGDTAMAVVIRVDC